MGRKIMVLMFVVGVLAGCAGPEVAQRPGERKLVETTPDRKPDWVGWAETMKDEKDRFLFIGAVKGKGDFALSIREAGIEATKIAGDQLARELSMALMQSKTGQNVEGGLGEQVRELFLQEVKGLKIMGLVQKERFVQEWEEGTISGKRRYFDAWTLLAIPKDDYLASRQALLDQSIRRAQGDRNAKAEKLLDDFRAEVKVEKSAQ
ncbi:MAG: hypothetical protein HZB91_03565 [Elusimicrobia bacterium]|nr:hypothetical protein [Elusimicrobiota bacterium]